MTKSKVARRRITFSIEAAPESKVAVAGTFNDWELVVLEPAAGDRAGYFQKGMLLAPGRYEYKFLIDDTWSIDPNCPSWSPNEHGSLNSVLEVS